MDISYEMNETQRMLGSYYSHVHVMTTYERFSPYEPQVATSVTRYIENGFYGKRKYPHPQELVVHISVRIVTPKGKDTSLSLLSEVTS